MTSISKTNQHFDSIFCSKYPRLLTIAIRSKQYLIYCRSGYRSSIAVSVLKNIGLQATDFVGGFAALNVHAPQSTMTGQVWSFTPVNKL